MILTLLGCTSPCDSPYTHGQVDTVTSGGLTWQRTAITEGVCGPAFGATADLDSDGQREVLLTNFGRPDGFALAAGSVLSIDPRDASTRAILAASEGVIWPNRPQPVDIDGDGDLDLLIGLGFLTCQLNPWTASCGGIIWLESGADWRTHEVVAPGAALFYHHPLLTDIDGDGIDDIVAVGESYAGPLGSEAAAEVQWWAGTGGGVFAAEPQRLAEGLGSLPQLWDIDGDGDLDLISGEYFSPDAASFAWLEQDDAGWSRHIIDDTIGPAIQGELVADLYGDGVTRMVGTNHTNTAAGDPWPSQIAVYTPGSDLTAPWASTVLYDGFTSDPSPTAGAPGIFSAGDIDADGDLDLLVSGDGDSRVVWLEQTAPGDFSVHTLEESLPQAGTLILENLDGDVLPEHLVSG